MTRRSFLGAALAAGRASAQTGADVLRIHRDALVFDAHVHMINLQFHKGGTIGERREGGHIDLPRAKEGGLDAMFFSLQVHERYYPARFETRQLLRLMDLAHREVEQHGALIEFAKNAADVQRIAGAGKIAALLDVEGGFDLDGDLGILRELHRLGLRSAQLPAHNWSNAFAESCCAPSKFKGLTAHGGKVVAEMNRLGMVINVSHASDTTMEQAIEISEKPVIATHHGLRSFNDIPRTMPEKLLEKLAMKGGLIGFHIGCEFHDRRFFEYRAKQEKRNFWDTRHIGAREQSMNIDQIDASIAQEFRTEGIDAPEDIKLTVEQWFRPVQRAIQIGGEDCVTLGSDWDGGPTLPRGMRDVRDLPMLTEAMLKLGWQPSRVKKFLGGNLLRLVRQNTGA